MKYIVKDSAPEELIEYSKTQGACYQDLYDNHWDIYRLTKESLVREQGYICCYCGQRIEASIAQIEHLFPKATKAYKIMQLDYDSNLIASCDGGKKERERDLSILPEHLHCDTQKSNDPIPVNPLDIKCEKKFIYTDDGEVFGCGKDAEATIEILNLSSPILNNLRKAAIYAYAFFPPESWSAEYKRLSRKNDAGEYEPFCFVLQQYIERNHGDQLISENKEKSEEKVETMV